MNNEREIRDIGTGELMWWLTLAQFRRNKMPFSYKMELARRMIEGSFTTIAYTGVFLADSGQGLGQKVAENLK